MREEKVTISILKWLDNKKWDIVCYDFPQSGTGILLQKNSFLGLNKNKGGIIPDIMAKKSDVVVYFENKDRYYAGDFTKIKDLKEKCEYSEAFTTILGNPLPKNIYYGVGIPSIPAELEKCLSSKEMIDFLVSVDENYSIKIHFGSEIFN